MNSFCRYYEEKINLKYSVHVLDEVMENVNLWGIFKWGVKKGIG